MNKELAQAWIKSVRLRDSQGDCPTEPALSIEQLEFLAMHFADLVGAAIIAANTVAVKQLEWEDDAPNDGNKAVTPFGNYYVGYDEYASTVGNISLCFHTHDLGLFHSMEKAQEYAQTDYRTRVMTTLIVEQAAGGGDPLCVKCASQQEGPVPIDCTCIPEDRIENALGCAMNALRSYQYGNSAPDLAESVANRCEAILASRKAIRAS